jgi:hypothetical protein
MSMIFAFVTQGILVYSVKVRVKAKLDMSKGKLEKELVDPYLPDKIVPPEYIRDVLYEANRDFPLIEFEYEVPHKWPIDEYKQRYESLEQQMLEIISWRVRWFGKKETNK